MLKSYLLESLANSWWHTSDFTAFSSRNLFIFLKFFPRKTPYFRNAAEGARARALEAPQRRAEHRGGAARVQGGRRAVTHTPAVREARR